MRAIVRAQKALQGGTVRSPRKSDARLFPPEEASLIGGLIARDAPFYEAKISPEAVDGLNKFAAGNGLIAEPVPYERMVATQFTGLWIG